MFNTASSGVPRPVAGSRASGETTHESSTSWLVLVGPNAGAEDVLEETVVGLAEVVDEKVDEDDDGTDVNDDGDDVDEDKVDDEEEKDDDEVEMDVDLEVANTTPAAATIMITTTITATTALETADLLCSKGFPDHSHRRCEI